MAELKPPLPLNALRVIAVVLLAFKVTVIATTPLFMDEAYYWLWGQHPALSYFDHPPLNAWLQGLSGLLLGWNVAAVRAAVVLTLLGDLGLLYLFARRLTPLDWRPTFWLSAILFLVTPIFFGLTGLALSDHLLIFFGLAALYFFVSFLSDWREGAAGSYRPLYLGALALGLAGLAKYNAALLGMGLFVFIALSARYRPMLANRHLWLAALLALGLQAPVLLWNWQQGFVSFEFILGTRHQGQSNPAGFSGVIGFLLGMVALLGPFLLLPLGRYLFSRDEPAWGLGKVVFWVSSGAILVAALSTDVLFHWNLVAYVAVLPFLALYLRQRWLLIGHMIYGLAAGALAVVNYTVVPVMALVSWTDQTTAWSYGWDEIAAKVEAARAAHQASFVAATDYALAAPLAFALKDKDTTSLSANRDQFDFWFHAEEHEGQAAIIVADQWRPLTPEIAARFTSVTPQETVAITRQAKTVNLYTIYLGSGFQGGPSN